MLQPMMIIALLPFAIGFESTRVATSVSLMRFASLSSFIQVCANLQHSIIYDLKFPMFMFTTNHSMVTIDIH